MTALSFDSYQIGLICALSIELVALLKALDKKHPTPENQPPNDGNLYTCGQIGKHNVVITSLPSGGAGQASATRAAISMCNTFPKLRLGLFVGIGGGIPRLYTPGSDWVDIRLGDIVVSSPEGTHGGVVQYDRGKSVTGANGEKTFQRVGSLNKPPVVLLNAVQMIRAELDDDYGLITEVLRMMQNKTREGRRKARFMYPGKEKDILFHAMYPHPGSSTNCRKDCDTTRTVDRDWTDRENEEFEPQVFPGTIASGGLVIKNAITRDELADMYGAKCVETEAAGIMDFFPCLVIRGISDYADSHKNDDWYAYASLTAAAYARLVLERLPVVGVERLPTFKEVVDQNTKPGSPSDDPSQSQPKSQPKETPCSPSDDPSQSHPNSQPKSQPKETPCSPSDDPSQSHPNSQPKETPSPTPGKKLEVKPGLPSRCNTPDSDTWEDLTPEPDTHQKEPANDNSSTTDNNVLDPSIIPPKDLPKPDSAPFQLPGSISDRSLTQAQVKDAKNWIGRVIPPLDSDILPGSNIRVVDFSYAQTLILYQTTSGEIKAADNWTSRRDLGTQDNWKTPVKPCPWSPSRSIGIRDAKIGTPLTTLHWKTTMPVGQRPKHCPLIGYVEVRLYYISNFNRIQEYGCTYPETMRNMYDGYWFEGSYKSNHPVTDVTWLGAIYKAGLQYFPTYQQRKPPSRIYYKGSQTGSGCKYDQIVGPSNAEDFEGLLRKYLKVAPMH
ncbi:purine and uridine phosphorylase [Ascobolus immersus RN42]|uniref:Purine and uridine phosphorylase n=1 Tax=Ascobolus immersus RN42 TaxID=1160509 RepID=A0A3N4HWZ2_ASCIM|nr:purine and uridine phosphorylase [Ascobolus immersus RN42]